MGRVRRDQENYITDSCINRSQKDYAKDAIIWLLARGSQTEKDISEHFGIPFNTVRLIIDELEKRGRVQRQYENKGLLKLRDPFRKT